MRDEPASPSATPLWLAALTCVLLLPFTGKALHIDDPLFVWTAQHVREHPLDFYGFDVNWYGWTQPISDIAQNPPLVSYYTALVGALFGFGERALHFAFLVPAALMIVGTWRLARGWTTRPALAALIALATPAFLVSSTTVMCDTSMVSLWVWAVVLWKEGLDEEKHAKLAGAALLVAAASLTKYFGMCLIPLLAAYTFARGARARAAWLLVPIGILALYQAWTSRLYGHGLLFQAAQYASEQRDRDANPRHVSLILGLVFAGGCMLPLVCFAHRVWSWRTLLVLALLGIASAVVVAATRSTGLAALPVGAGMRFGIAAQVALWSAVGAGVILLCVDDVRSRRDATSLLLALWVLGAFAFACFVNWTINGRSLLPMAPAVALLIARKLDSRVGSARPRDAGVAIAARAWRELALLVPGLLAGLCIAWADERLAAAGRSAAEEIAEHHAGASGRLCFEGHWGFQHYLQSLGGEALDFKTFHLEIGDWVVAPYNTVGAHPLPERVRETVGIVERPVLGWISTMDHRVGAGFYAGNLGLLPFTVGPNPNEIYSILRITTPVGAK